MTQRQIKQQIHIRFILVYATFFQDHRPCKYAYPEGTKARAVQVYQGVVLVKLMKLL